jgi:hypothetical protein
MKLGVILFVCIGFVFAEEIRYDSCLAAIPKSLGLNMALNDSLDNVLKKYRLSKTKNAMGQTYWFSRLKIHDVPIYMQCFFENGKLIDVFITHKIDMPCDDSANISKEISLVNSLLTACLNRSFDIPKHDGHDMTFDTVVSTVQIRYSYLLSTTNRKKCGFSFEIENALTDHYLKREEQIEKLLRKMR